MASLSRIVKNLSVAKGSFYRYFENKLDLYKYLIDYATKVKANLVEKELKKPVNNIVDLFNEDFLRAPSTLFSIQLILLAEK